MWSIIRRGWQRVSIYHHVEHYHGAANIPGGKGHICFQFACHFFMELWNMMTSIRHVHDVWLWSRPEENTSDPSIYELPEELFKVLASNQCWQAFRVWAIDRWKKPHYNHSEWIDGKQPWINGLKKKSRLWTFLQIVIHNNIIKLRKYQKLQKCLSFLGFAFAFVWHWCPALSRQAINSLYWPVYLSNQ